MTSDIAEFGTAVLEGGTPDSAAFPQPSSKVGSLSPIAVSSLNIVGMLGQKFIKKIHTENL